MPKSSAAGEAGRPGCPETFQPDAAVATGAIPTDPSHEEPTVVHPWASWPMPTSVLVVAGRDAEASLIQQG